MELSENKVFETGLSLFNAGEFFEAHEVWEDLWRKAQDPDKAFLQALIQMAVGLHHQEGGKAQAGARMAAKAMTHLKGLPPMMAGMELKPLRTFLEAWISEGRTPAPRLPL